MVCKFFVLVMRQDVMKRVEFEATICSDNSFHDDHALSSLKQVCTTLLGLFQIRNLLAYFCRMQHHRAFKMVTDRSFQFKVRNL